MNETEQKVMKVLKIKGDESKEGSATIYFDEINSELEKNVQQQQKAYFLSTVFKGFGDQGVGWMVRATGIVISGNSLIHRQR